MEVLHCEGQAAFLRRQEGYPNNHAPNDNTPVKTGVLWSLWVGVELGARAGLAELDVFSPSQLLSAPLKDKSEYGMVIDRFDLHVAIGARRQCFRPAFGCELLGNPAISRYWRIWLGVAGIEAACISAYQSVGRTPCSCVRALIPNQFRWIWRAILHLHLVEQGCGLNCVQGDVHIGYGLSSGKTSLIRGSTSLHK